MLAACVVGGAMTLEDLLVELELAMADADGDDAESAAIQMGLAEGALVLLHLERALEHFRAAIAFSKRVEDATTDATALAGIGFVECLLGRGVTESATKAYAVWDGMPPSVLSYSPRMSLAEVSLYAADFVEAQRLYLEEIEMAEQHGLEVVEVIARGHLAEAQARSGSWSAAFANGRLAHEHARQAADEQIINGTAYPLGLTEALLGDLEAARARASNALAVAEATGDSWHTTLNRSVLGLVALSAGDAVTAVDVLVPAWGKMLESELGDYSIFPIGHMLGEALVVVDRLDDALAVAAALHACPAGNSPWCRAMAARVEALAASARGDHGAARGHIAVALAALAERPEPFEQARTVHILGRIERRARNWGAARAAFVDALERFDELGAARWAETAAADIARLPGRRPSDGKSLTAREREVAELAASGLSNKEVAARLFVSKRTVEANLSKVYAKLEVRSRAALSRALGDEPR